MRLHGHFKLLSMLVAAAILVSCGAHPTAAVNAQSNVSRTSALGSNLGLHTQGNLILDGQGQVWMARGVNIFDTRGCNSCAYQAPNVQEVLRRADAAITQWHATLLRVNLESYGTADGRTQWGGVLQDANYLADVKTIVDHTSQYQGVTILLSLLIDPTFNAQQIPTQGTADEWTLLTKTFANYPNVIFGVGNEPHNNSTDDATTIADQNQNTWQGMTTSVNAIRAVEDGMGITHHLVAVQGTTWWARYTAWYETNPIQSDNIVYETHIYDPTANFPIELTQPHQTLPMIIGEFGDWPGEMEAADCDALMNLADQLQVPYIGWSFSASCGAAPLLQATTTDACGVDAPLTPTAWGTQLQTHLLATQPDVPVYTGPKPTPTPTPTPTPVTTPGTDPNVVILPMPTPTTTPETAPTVDPAPVPTPTADPAPVPTPTAAPAPVAGSGAISLSGTGMCVDVPGGMAFDYSGVVISECNNGHATESWTYTGGTLQSQGKCVSVVNAAAPGAFLQLQPCDGRASEQFSVTGQTITAGGLCLDTLGGLTYSLMPVVLNACNGSATQRFVAQ